MEPGSLDITRKRKEVTNGAGDYCMYLKVHIFTTKPSLGFNKCLWLYFCKEPGPLILVAFPQNLGNWDFYPSLRKKLKLWFGVDIPDWG